MDRKKILKIAKQKAARLARLRKDPRYQKTLGKLRGAGILHVEGVPPFRGMLFLQDALWAAELEPRIYELLPALLVKRPKFFAYTELPEDLKKVIQEVKAGKAETYFRGVKPKDYEKWIPVVGRKNDFPLVMKSFRMRREDLQLLNQIKRKTGESYIEILRKALRNYSKEKHD